MKINLTLGPKSSVDTTDIQSIEEKDDSVVVHWKAYRGGAHIYTSISKTLLAQWYRQYAGTPYTYWDTGLPVVVIDTPGGVPITSKEVWIEGTFIKIYTDRNTVVYESDALSIRGRGNSSWDYGVRIGKKPYALKFEEKTELLGMPKSKRWALLANYGDRTLMRNRIANEIAQCTDLTTGMGWSPMGEFVELVLNGEHVGNYYLSEQIRVEKNRLNIDSDNDWLLEIDRYYADEEYYFKSPIEDFAFVIKSPEEPNVQAIESYIDYLEAYLFANERISEYRAYLDYNSFADYWIVEELCQNFECRSNKSIHLRPGSVYCYYLVNSGNGILKMGPPWDFDYSTFNLYWPLKAGDELCSGTVVSADGYMPKALAITEHLYYGYLFKDSEFKTVVKQRWNSMKPKLDAILSRFDYWYNTLLISEQLNWSMWAISSTFEPGHHPDYDLTFLKAKDYAKEFYRVRLNFLDNWINNL